jgi:hypothetical protein
MVREPAVHQGETPRQTGPGAPVRSASGKNLGKRCIHAALHNTPLKSNEIR